MTNLELDPNEAIKAYRKQREEYQNKLDDARSGASIGYYENKKVYNSIASNAKNTQNSKFFNTFFGGNK